MTDNETIDTTKTPEVTPVKLTEDEIITRHESRRAEDYLANIIRNSQYIENVAAILEKATAEMKNGKDYHDAVRLEKQNYNINQEQSRIKNAISNAISASGCLKDGLKNAEALATANQIEDADTISRLKTGARDAGWALKYIAGQRPTVNNGLSQETIIDAQAALDTMKNRLTRVVAGDAGRMDAHVGGYNIDYVLRMAEAQRHTKPYEIPAETRIEKNRRDEKTSHELGIETIPETSKTRIGGYKEMHEKRMEQLKESSRRREEIRTGKSSFREAVEAKPGDGEEQHR